MSDYFDPSNQNRGDAEPGFEVTEKGSPDVFDASSKGTAPQAMPGMKWYKFLIYFLLFLNALVSIGDAARAFTGMDYHSEGVTPEMVFAFYPGLKTVTMFSGIAGIALAVFAIVVRQELAHFKKRGPKDFLALYVVGLVLTLVIQLATGTIISGKLGVGLGEAVSFGQLAGACAVRLVWILLHRTYFEKRAFLFVN